MSGDWFVGADIGGTFTDVVAVGDAGALLHLKVPSSRSDPASSVVRGLQALRETQDVEPSRIRLILHGTTLATNAIIERRLARTALVTTEGFKDVLEIGRHWRKELYDPFADRPAPLVSRDLRFEVRERLAVSGEELEPLDLAGAERVAEELRRHAIEAVAVVFLHSYRDARHELEMAEVLGSAGGWFVCCSSTLTREVREYERTSTTVLNVALMPLLDNYLTRLEANLGELGFRGALFVTQSNGGAMTPRAARGRPINLALSGPVGGVVACVRLGKSSKRGALIGLDMGGTSTDVSIITDYEPRFSSEMTIGELPVRVPSVQVISIGAGGGSVASLDSAGALRVGPESAGSDPGPACYDNGGLEPTVTDCQLILGRLSEDVPLAGGLELSLERAREAVERRIASRLGLSVEAAAAGIIEVANAAMEGAIRVALRERGDDPRSFSLVAFGGAGPLHAVELAQRLSVGSVIVPPHPGTLSALGFLGADVRLDFSSSEPHRSDEPALSTAVAAAFEALEARARSELGHDRGLADAPVLLERSCDIRYLGQAHELNVPLPGSQIGADSMGSLLAEFHRLHARAYGFESPDELCELMTFRLSARVPLNATPVDAVTSTELALGARDRRVYLPETGVASIPIYDRSSLVPGVEVDGAAVIHQDDATTLLLPSTHARVDQIGNLVVAIPAQAHPR